MSQTLNPMRIISGLGEATPAPPETQALPILQLDKRTYSRALDCVHCGLCLPVCPTYTENGLEADSPRGRIYLMKGLADGKIEPTPAVIEHLDLCLDCRACETACPSGVQYHELIEETRAKLGEARPRGVVDRVVHFMFFHVFPYRTRLQLAMIGPRILQRIGLWKPLTSGSLRKLLPAQIEKMQQMLPERGPMWEAKLEAFYPAKPHDGKKRATVGLLAGCVGSVLFQDVNRQTIDLLQLAGCDVVVPSNQTCCGALHHHGGHWDQARRFAKSNIEAFLPKGERGTKVDFIVNNAAGCGAMLKEYGHLLRDDAEYAEQAHEFDKRSRDISELLAQLDMPAPTHPVASTATYHDACHLAHAQKVTAPPRKLLGRIPQLKLVPLAESDMCCGAAGTYNLAHPQMARDLAERKIGHIRRTGAAVCVTGNVGCAMQIQSEANRMGETLQVAHPVTLLHRAYFGSSG